MGPGRKRRSSLTPIVGVDRSICPIGHRRRKKQGRNWAPKLLATVSALHESPQRIAAALHSTWNLWLIPMEGWCQKRSQFGYPDPSRGPKPGAGGKPADGHGDPAAPQGSAGGGGWPHDVAVAAPCGDSAHCSTAVLGHRNGRSRKSCRTHRPGKLFDEKPVAKCPFPLPRGRTGQRPPIMAGYIFIGSGSPLTRAARIRPRLLAAIGVFLFRHRQTQYTIP